VVDEFRCTRCQDPKTTKRIRAKKRVIFKSKEQAKTDTYILLAVAALRAVKYGPWMLANQNAKANRPIMLAHNKRIDNAVGWLQSICGAINNK
jgi:hypothetical protein